MDSLGDVYVVDRNNHRVQKFGPAGDFILMFGGEVNRTKSEEVGSTEAERNLCTAASGDVCQAGTTGGGDGQFEQWPVSSLIAIGPGDEIYVGDQGRIQTFGAGGAYSGDVADPEGIIAGGEFVASLAADGSGSLLVGFATSATAFTPKPNVLKLTAGGEDVCTINTPSPTAVAASAAGDVYVVENSSPVRVRQFAADCGDREMDFGAGAFTRSTGIGLASPPTCGLDGPLAFVANADSGASFLRAYGSQPDPAQCPPPLRPPRIEAQYAFSADSGGAVVRAEINPRFFSGGSEALGTTDYYVQYGTEKCVDAGGFEATCASERPAAPGVALEAGAVDEPVVTGVLLGDLAPNTSYRFRFVAQSKGGGPVFGEGEEECVLDPECGEGSSFTTFPPAPPPKTDCANQSRRYGPSGSLPDCRAYEMVSPVDKEGGEIAVLRGNDKSRPASLEQGSVGGGRLTYSSYEAFADPPSSPFTSQYLATRGGEGWASVNLGAPRRGQPLIESNLVSLFKAFDSNLCQAWMVQDSDVQMDPQAPSGYVDLYRRRQCGGGPWEALIRQVPQEVEPGDFEPQLQGASADGTHTIFRAPGKLTSGAAPGTVAQLYEHVEDEGLRLVCVLPGGEASEGGCTAGTREPRPGVFFRDDNVHNAISEDGSRIFWTDAATAGPIYVRIDGAETVPVSEGAEALSGTSASRYWGAAADGSRAIFTTGEDLYGFLLDDEETTLIAGDVAGVMGMSEDGGRVYFASEEAIAGSGENSEGAEAQAGQPNLYLYEAGEGGGAGAYLFLATLTAADVSQNNLFNSVVHRFPYQRTSRVTPDGGAAAFTSRASLTGFDNTDANSGKADLEVFLYDAEENELRCASCNHSGARPVGRDLLAGSNEEWVAAQIPGWNTQFYPSRLLSADGERLFFESFEALVLRDTNGAQDVYEWQLTDGKIQCLEEIGGELFTPDADGEGGGCIALISSGESPDDSEFLDADLDGSDVFFKTSASLAPQDPGLIDVYDARALGGFPPPEPPREPCEGEACQNPDPAPEQTMPSSPSFQGPGDLAAPRPSLAPCRRAARRALRISRRAKQLRRVARRVARRPVASRRASRLQVVRVRRVRRQAIANARRAKRVAVRAKRCRARVMEANASGRAER